jgi:dihydroflavonol-4-reductase
MADDDLVLVTGAAGFIAKECIVHALAGGYRVRGTVRRPEAEAEVRAVVPDAGDRLSFVKADLLADEGWDAAMRGCRYVLHVASPYPLAAPKDRMALVPPARDGTLRVLKAAVRGEVERVVVTSSLAAVISGFHSSRRDKPFGESDWSDPDSSNISPYSLSKTLAERAAWDFMKREGGATSLVSVNPGGVYGPARDRAVEASAEIIANFMKGRYPLVPHLGMGVVDVRDVATAHLSAATVPAAANRRFLLSAGPMLMIEIGRLLGATFPQYRWKMPRGEMPDWLVRVYALFDATARSGIPELGEAPRIDTEPAHSILGLTFRPADQAIVAMARSLIDLKMV